ncbi:hypothetical protein CU254_23050 [Amycolatopsis sp. AA4]|uniref:hypothetical protein n=1 Tax=Actinomycetes TaxID=1760 RepID=UPI0001B545A9|nr:MULTISPECIES: hypothetical protein [Actinomycetes]ATY12999.1 hypothetical protein CU254_23050 [Amycolatopsis sp. AA4]
MIRQLTFTVRQLPPGSASPRGRRRADWAGGVVRAADPDDAVGGCPEPDGGIHECTPDSAKNLLTACSRRGFRDVLDRAGPVNENRRLANVTAAEA